MTRNVTPDVEDFSTESGRDILLQIIDAMEPLQFKEIGGSRRGHYIYEMQV